MATGTIKGFYRQRKTTKTKLSSSKTTAKGKKSVKASVALQGKNSLRPAVAGFVDILDEDDKHEELLKQFDLNMNYGPCVGLSRLARWDRANKLGLNPPKEVEKLLGGGNVALECLLDGRF